MKVLAVETSSLVAGVAILDDDRLIYEGYNHHKRNHSEILMPMVENALSSCELSLRDIDVYAVSKGPGSFTGLRIGIATVKGLAEAVERPIAAIPTLDVLAYNFPYWTGLVCPILDARREQVYTCIYRWEQDQHTRLIEYKAIPIAELAETLINYNEPVIFVGDGIKNYKEIIIQKIADKAYFAPTYLSQQRAAAAAWLGLGYVQEGKCINYSELVPFYLRQSQAEQKKYKMQGENHG